MSPYTYPAKSNCDNKIVSFAPGASKEENIGLIKKELSVHPKRKITYSYI